MIMVSIMERAQSDLRKLTLYVVIPSIFIGVIAPFWYFLGRSGLGHWADIGLTTNISSVSVTEFFLLFIAWLFSRIKIFKRRLNVTALSYLYIVGVCSAFYVILGWDPAIMSIFSRVSMDEALSQKYVPWFLAPPKSAVEDMIYARVSFPLGTWAPSLAFWWLLYTIPGIFLISVVTLFRRLWIDAEKVPFPYTGIVYETLSRIPESSSTEHRMSIFKIGFIAGIIFQVPVLLTQVFQWFPDIYAIRGNCCGYVWYVRTNTPFAQIIGLGTANLQPLMAAIAYFVPVKILFNFWFWYLVYIILMQVAYYLGYYTGTESVGGCGRGWCASYSGLFESPYKFMAISQAGGMMGLVIMSLWLSRSYIAETFRAAFGNQDREKLKEFESGEPMSYKSIWLLLIISFIGTIGTFMAIGPGFFAAFLIPITFFIYYFANARLYGMSGFYMRGMEHGTSLYRLLMWPTRPEAPTREFVMTSVFIRTNVDTSSGKLFGSILGSFASYKMASLTGTSTRDTFKVILITTMIVPIVTLISLFTIMGSTIGLDRAGLTGASYVGYSSFSFYGESPNWENMPVAGSDWLYYVIIGIVIVCALQWLNARFIWFPFEPIGFINGTSYNSVLSGLWLSFLVAWILKVIIMRVGGSRVYERVGHIVGGFVAGCMVVYIISGIVGIMRFFVPF